jgi:hypothetical protein
MRCRDPAAHDATQARLDGARLLRQDGVQASNNLAIPSPGPT